MNKFGQKGHLTIVALAFRYQKTLTQTRTQTQTSAYILNELFNGLLYFL